MRSFAPLAFALLAAACGDAPDRSPEPAAAEQTPNAFRAAGGTVRVPYLGGAFVTKNREMPIDVEQAIAGEPTDHPVIVWAGD